MNLKKIPKDQFSKNSGFTLIELAIVIIITGLLFIPLVRAYYIYEKGKKVQETKNAVILAKSLISYYKGTTPLYPCPADASLLKTDPMYGISQCGYNIGLNTGDCTTGGGLCVIPGERNISPLSNVIVGSIPTTTIKQLLGNSIPFAESDLIDAWGNRIMYAVSQDLTSPWTYNFNRGVIGALDEFGRPTAGIQNDAHYAVFSPGRDQRGGFNDYGNLKFPCNTSVNSKDFENCDNANGVFVQAKGYYLDTGGDTYYDDDIFFGKEFGASVWAYEQDFSNIRTTIQGNVGIGTNTPSQKLTIENTAGVAELSADNSVFVKQICDENGINCFRIDSITGSGAIQCSGGEVMSGVSNGQHTCVPQNYALPPLNFSCPSGSYINGFRSNGDVICTP